ncbi:hypothetical protein OG599_19760 [Streptomyces sp. NBC_01335]|uniref:hypothetical protein n=1 Tax=Streptomyces sp. NBC_01335 TaxID=2903828 RepID=UPI002E150D3F|nr:hypothetical protein OG599_19760 [Streptomyces sp. NBC_01335]
MSDPSPLVVVSGALWVAAAGASVIIATVRSFRIRRRSAANKAGTRAPWAPFGPECAWPLVAAAVGYAVEAVIVRRLSLGDASQSIWWPAFAASALTYVAQRRLRGPAKGFPALFAAVGAVLFGPVFG